MQQIQGWWHVATMGRWVSIARDQLQSIEASGLLEASGGVVNACVSGTGDTSWLPSWVVIHRQQDDWQDGENPTLRVLRQHQVQSQARYVWYIHTKGASNLLGDSWRHYLEYFTVWRWKACVEALEAGHDACGVDWVTPQTEGAIGFMGHIPGANAFLGNFWWSTGGHIASIPDVMTGNRFDAEWWFVGMNNPRVKCFHFSGVNHYDTDYRPASYSVPAPTAP